MMTKEKFEADVLKFKRQIIKRRKMEVAHRLLKFKTTNEEDYRDFKQAIIYFFFIVGYVSLILLQINNGEVSFTYYF